MSEESEITIEWLEGYYLPTFKSQLSEKLAEEIGIDLDLFKAQKSKLSMEDIWAKIVKGRLDYFELEMNKVQLPGPLPSQFTPYGYSLSDAANRQYKISKSDAEELFVDADFALSAMKLDYVSKWN